MMRCISSEEGFYIIRIKKNVIRKVCAFIALTLFLAMAFIVFHSYRYERFKDGHKYMRYDKWLDKYQKYDIPTKKWNDITK